MSVLANFLRMHLSVASDVNMCLVCLCCCPANVYVLCICVGYCVQSCQLMCFEREEEKCRVNRITGIGTSQLDDYEG